MKLEETKAKLQEGAARTVAREGLEKTSTKLIAYEANVNEVFIFRYYGGKDNLLDETFLTLDRELSDVTFRELQRNRSLGLSPEKEVRNLMEGLWDFLIEKKEELLFYSRYMNSASFLRVAALKHREILSQLAADSDVPFSDEEIAELTMQHLNNALVHVVLQAQFDETGFVSLHRNLSVDFLTDITLAALRRAGSLPFPEASA